MKRLYRQLLFFISTVVFLALAPLVILYAMGYRTGVSNVDPVPVGVLLVETFPRRAELVINDQNVGRTPRSVPNLPAGTVHVRLTKEGYTDWEKNLQVKPGLVTELRGVRLLKEDSIPTAIQSGIELISLSPNRQLLAVYGSKKTLQIFDQGGQPVTAEITLKRSPHAMLWAPNSSHLLLLSSSGAVDLFDVASPARAPLPQPFLTGAQHMVWDPRIPSRILALTPQGVLRAYNTASRASAVIATNVETFATTDRNIYAVDRQHRIKMYTLQGEFVRTLPITLTGTVQRLLLSSDNRLAVQLATHEIFIVRDDKLIPISPDVKTAAWSPDGRMLLVQPEATALYIYNEADERSVVPLQALQLVTRLSRSIASAQWFAGGQHLIYQVDDEVRIIEIDVRDHAIDRLIDTTNLGNAQALVGEDGEVLYYLKRNNGSNELVQTSLIIPQ